MAADTTKEEPLIIGVHPIHVHELQDIIKAATDEGFGFVVVPFVHPRFKRGDTVAAARKVPFARSDLVLTAHQWSCLVVGQISAWINLDSSDKVRSVGLGGEVACRGRRIFGLRFLFD